MSREYKIGDKVTVGGIEFTKHSDLPFGPSADLAAVLAVDLEEAHVMIRRAAEDEDYGCCALEDGHDGPCAYVCSECNGTTYCWQCGGPSGDDLGTGCGNCDGTGYCFSCYEGMVTEDA